MTLALIMQSLPRILFGAILSSLMVGNALAGITIHFRGEAKDAAAVEAISDDACSEAVKNQWRCERIVGDQIARLDPITAKSIADLEKSPELSQARGVVIHMHEMAEPLYLVFGKSLKTANFVKTQFAGAAVHIRAVELLRKVKTHFASLEVVDEGGYWDTNDRGKLEQELDAVNTLIARIRSEKRDVRGPVKRPDGRILDLVR